MRTKRYLFLLMVCAAGITWFFLNRGKNPVINQPFCLFKSLTTLPCPSCGTTRSVNALVSGNLTEAWYANPFGFVVLPIMFILPLWIVLDFLFHTNSLLRSYSATETLLKKKPLAVILIMLVLVNWARNLVNYLW